MKNQSIFWLFIFGVIVFLIVLIDKANKALKEDDSVAYFGQNILEPAKVEAKKKTETTTPTSSVYVTASQVKMRDANGSLLVNAKTKQSLYFLKEDNKIGQFAGNVIINGLKYVAVRKTSDVAPMWSIKGLSAVSIVYIWRDAVQIK